MKDQRIRMAYTLRSQVKEGFEHPLKRTAGAHAIVFFTTSLGIMDIRAYLNLAKWNLSRRFGFLWAKPSQSEADILKIENEVLKSRLEFAQREIEDVVAASMQEVCGEELLQELMRLDSSNGWGVDYKPGVFVRFVEVKKGIKALFAEYKSFPVGSMPEGNFTYCLTVGEGGEPVLFEQHEVSMLNYKIFRHENKPLDELIDLCANAMFRVHINKIRVLHNA
ncbi:hypothetical protein [Roseateles asaccharophilus]|uniref:hypothetical protein n=1 Tax=Roseateles asaccharophilus TaxID=582607 RepID=UPI001B87F700|nr:hypothetical protein [Roseateles asaccharophilus]